MAKKGKGKAKLPKTVAGVKVPKSLRQGSALAGLLDSPLTRKILADALLAAAGAAAAALVQKRPSPEDVKDVAQAAVGAVGGVVAEAARQVLPASLTGEDRDRDQDRRRDRDRYTVLA